MKKKAQSSLAISLSNATNELPPLLNDAQVVGPSSLPGEVVQSGQRLAHRTHAHTQE